jgi:CelD/BcsL family acetyltransferase involved in cellulose biosynthesis
VKLEVLQAPEVLDELGGALDELHAAAATPVTARRPWLATWLSSFPYEPLVLVILGGDRLEAAALLAQRRRHGVTEVVAMGHGPSDRVAFPSRGPEASLALSQAMAGYLLGLKGPWRLAVGHLPVGDPVATALAGGLPFGQLIGGADSPALRFGEERTLRGYVSRNHHQQVRRVTNRMEREGLAPAFEHLREPADLRAALPEVERVCRQRDAMVRRRSQLDDPSFGPFFRAVVLEHARRGEVDLTTLRLQGELAAYCLCFVDGGSYRMWNCRFAPRWAHLSPGRVTNNEALRHALADPACQEFDWMLGEEDYKSGLANHVDPSQDLLAWSSRPVWAVYHSRRRLLAGLKDVKDRHELLQRAWAGLKSTGRGRRMPARPSS